MEVSVDTLDMIDVVQWYTELVLTLLPLNIALLIFDAVVVRMEIIGLCLPGNDTVCCRLMGPARFNLLSKKLPSEKEDIDFWISINSNSARDRYTLIHLFFTLSLPGFSRSLVMNYIV